MVTRLTMVNEQEQTMNLRINTPLIWQNYKPNKRNIKHNPG